MVWKVIQDLPTDTYLINELGMIKNKKTERILKTRIGANGYRTLTITINRKVYSRRIHRLIAIAFIPNPNNYPMIDHINRIKGDNRLINLRWVNNSMNQLNRDKYEIRNQHKRYRRFTKITKSGNRYSYKFKDKYVSHPTYIDALSSQLVENIIYNATI